MKRLITLVLVVAGTLQLNAQDFKASLFNKDEVSDIKSIGIIDGVRYYTGSKSKSRYLFTTDEANKVINFTEIEAGCIDKTQEYETFVNSENMLCLIAQCNKINGMEISYYDAELKFSHKVEVPVYKRAKDFFEIYRNGDYVLGYFFGIGVVYNVVDQQIIQSIDVNKGSIMAWKTYSVSVSSDGSVAGVIDSDGSQYLFTAVDGKVTNKKISKSSDKHIGHMVSFYPNSNKFALVYSKGDEQTTYTNGSIKIAEKVVSVNTVSVAVYNDFDMDEPSEKDYAISEELISQLNLKTGIPGLKAKGILLADNHIDILLEQEVHTFDGSLNTFYFNNILVVSISGEQATMKVIKRDFVSDTYFPSTNLYTLGGVNYILYYEGASYFTPTIKLYNISTGETVLVIEPDKYNCKERLRLHSVMIDGNSLLLNTGSESAGCEINGKKDRGIGMLKITP